MKQLKAILVILFLLLVIIVAVQNHAALSTTVKFRVDLVFFDYQTGEMSLYFVSVITFLLGVFFAGLIGIAERFRLNRQIKNLGREIKEKDKELNSLRNLPVTAEAVSSEQNSEQNPVETPPI
ncbi:MAG: LapA family protein [Desulfatiglandaceae bacterium]|jgi:ATP adenylyltransferase